MKRASGIFVRPSFALTVGLIVLLFAIGHYRAAVTIAAISVIYVYGLFRLEAKKLAYLRGKYGDEAIVQRIFAGEYPPAISLAEATP